MFAPRRSLSVAFQGSHSAKPAQETHRGDRIAGLLVFVLVSVGPQAAVPPDGGCSAKAAEEAAQPAASEQTARSKQPTEDQHGDPLPEGAIARLGWIHAAELRTLADKKAAASKGHTSGLYEVLFSPDGQTIATRAGDRRCILWDSRTGTLRRRLEDHISSIRAMTFSPNGQSLLTSASRGRMLLWELSSQSEPVSLGPGASVVQFSPDGQFVRVVQQETIRQIAAEDGTTKSQASGPAYPIAFSPNGQLLAAIARYGENTIRLFDSASGKQVRELTGFEAHPIALAFSPDGRTLAAGGRDETIRSWEVATGRTLHVWEGHRGPVQAIAFSSQGRYLASGGWDQTVRVWEVSTGRQVAKFLGHTGRVTSVAFSPHGTSLVSASLDRTGLIWSLAGTSVVDRKVLKLREVQLRKLWQDLAVLDAPVAYKAMQQLSDSPDSALGFLEKQIKPLLGPTQASDINQLIAQLDHDRWEVREQAMDLLLRLREVAEEQIRQTLKKDLCSLEQRKRLQAILDASWQPPVSPTELRRLLRVVQLLEQLGSQPARDLLTSMRQNVPSKTVVREARAALDRLHRKAG